MSIRRLQYQIDYIHIITFQEEYKRAIAPYFALENAEYVIDDENTINEGIKLLFRNENFAIVFKKENIIFLFEGDINDLKNQNGIIKLFWDLYEKAKNFYGYTKTVRHYLTVHAVSIRPREEVDRILESNPYLSNNPFGQLEEFSCVYQFQNDDIAYKFYFGNYSDKDIKIHDLSPFKSKYNQDLTSNFGMMGRMEVIHPDKNPTFGKFKSLIIKAENNLSLFNL